MKKYLRAFKTQAEYLTFTASTEFELDNVCSCREGDLVYYNSEECGGQGIHRTISGETYCDGYDKRVYIYKQVSYDDGATWETTATTSALVERNSEDCGYVPPSYYDITAKFNVTSTGIPTRVASATTNFSKIEIDGVEQPSVVSEYTFSTTGEHTVKYGLIYKNIDTEAFSGCSDMTSCSIGDNVTAIGSDAFDDCTSLTSCTIGSGVTSIGDWAFYNCRSLASIDIPSGVTSIGNGVFYKCSGLTSCTIGSGVTNIGQSAFGYCRSLTSIDIPNSLTNIGNFAFSACTSLTSIDIPSSVTSIGFSAFTSCSGLTSITVNSNNTEYDSRNNCNAIIETSTNTLIQGCKNTIIPNSVTTIGNGAFENCSSLTSIEIPNSVTRIYHDVFRGCSSLTSIDIPNSVTSIGGWAFDNCTSLTSCTIGSGVTTIGDYVFYQCSGLTSVTVNATTPPTLGSSVFIDTNNCPIYVPCDSVDTYKAASGWSTYASRIQAIPGSCPQWDVIATFNVTDTSSSTKIANNTTGLSKIMIDGVEQLGLPSGYTFTTLGEHIVKYMLADPTSIGGGVFNDCSGLTSCTIGSGVTSIGYRAFAQCSGLTSIDILGNVTSISDYAFNNCRSLTSIDIPSGVTSIGAWAFYYCTGLTSVTIEAITPPSISYSFGSTNNCPIYVPCDSVDTYKAASGWSAYASRIQAIAGSCWDITAKFNVTDTNNPTKILAGVSRISEIEIDNIVQPNVTSGYTFDTTGEHIVKYMLKDKTSIGNNTFYQCGKLTSIIIPNSVTSIGSGAFWVCTGLTSINIPDGVTSISEDAFRQCTSLTSIVIPSGVTSISQGCFSLCTSLTNINVPSGITSIGNNAFYSATSITSIDIPDSVTSIGNYVFYCCRNLTSINIPSGVTSIGSRTFDTCKSLSSMTVDINNTIYDSRNNCNAIIKTNDNELIYGCKDTIIPNTITSIGEYAFRCSTNLTNIVIPNSVTNIGAYAFDTCTGLTSITIPDSVTNIGNGAFNYCSGMTSCTMGSGVTSIGNNAFWSCSNLTSIDIPSGITSIGDNAFYICNNLTSVTVEATTPPTLANVNAFSYTNNYPIYVPCDSVDTYKAATNWSTYASRIRAIVGSCP